MKTKDLAFPVAALAAEGDDNAAPPAVGDVVSFKVEGRVTKVDGETVSVCPSAINGTPLDDAGAEPPAQPDDGTVTPPSRAELENWARESGMAN